MMHDGNGFHWFFGFGHWAYGTLIWITIIALLVWLIKSLFGK